MNNVRRARTAIFLVLAATFPAAAQDAVSAPKVDPAATSVTAPAASQPAPTATIAPAGSVDSSVDKAPGSKPWRGTSISYGLTTPTSKTFDPAFQKTYQPSLMHQLDLQPEWHFGDQVYLRARFLFAQEFFTGTSATYGHQIIWSDPTIELGAAGIEDPVAHLRLSGSLRFIPGLSKASALETRVVSIAPGLSLSRNFELLSGLQVRYAARLSQHFHRFTTGQNAGADVPELCAQSDVSCRFRSNGSLNTHTDLVHGPGVAFSPIEKLNLSASFDMYRGWRYSPTPVDGEDNLYQPLQDPGTTDAWGVSAGVGYDVLPFLSLSLSGTSFAPQLTTESTYENPLYNRYTQLSLDLGLDVEALLQRI